MNLAKNLLNKYGPMLSTSDLAEVFKYKNGKSVQEALYRETFPSAERPLQVKRLGKKIVAYYETVAKYLEHEFEQE